MSNDESPAQEPENIDLTDLESARWTTKTVRKLKFRIKALTPKERKAALNRIATETFGLPATAYADGARYPFERSAFIDAALQGSTEKPSWWKEADQCMDDDLLNQLFDAVQKWDSAFQAKLKKNPAYSGST